MQKMVYNIAKMLFNGSFVDEISGFLSAVFDALGKMLDKTFMATVLNSFAAIAVSLLILYFFMDLVSQASKDMFSMEKLIISFIKLFVAMAVLICLPELISGLVNIGKALYMWASSNDSGSLRDTLFNGKGNFQFKLGTGGNAKVTDKFPSFKQIEDAGLWEFELSKILDMFNLFLITILVSIVNFVIKLAAYFLAVTNALAIIGRAIFSPLAVVQLFEDGTRSAGIRYLKIFAAECMQMATMVVILYASSKLTGYMMSTMYDSSGFIEVSGDKTIVDLTRFEDNITFGNLPTMILPQFAAIGGMMGVSKITRDVIG